MLSEHQWGQIKNRPLLEKLHNKPQSTKNGSLLHHEIVFLYWCIVSKGRLFHRKKAMMHMVVGGRVVTVVTTPVVKHFSIHQVNNILSVNGHDLNTCRYNQIAERIWEQIKVYNIYIYNYEYVYFSNTHMHCVYLG